VALHESLHRTTVGAGKIKTSGNPMQFAELIGLLDELPRMFELVEPRWTAVT
jgi:alkyl sulfatase BDS1-like metallo-beta-lactamase superfamily hydrolase